MKTVMFIMLGIIVPLILITFFINSRSKAQGVDNLALFKCPSSANCISSSDNINDPHYFAPLEMDAAKFKKLQNVLVSMNNIAIVTHKDNYIHAIAKTNIGFKDDLEFLFDEKNSLCFVRSASRTGIRDFGVNKKRILFIKGNLK